MSIWLQDRARLTQIMTLLLAALIMVGCLGIGDAFAEKRRIGGDYSLGEFEDGEIYLWVQGQSTSVAGPIRQIAWNQDFIVVNSPISSSKWMIVRIYDHRALSGIEKTGG